MNATNKELIRCKKCGEKVDDPESFWCDDCFVEDIFETYSNMFKKEAEKVQQKPEPIVEDSHFDWWGADSL